MRPVPRFLDGVVDDELVDDGPQPLGAIDQLPKWAPITQHIAFDAVALPVSARVSLCPRRGLCSCVHADRLPEHEAFREGAFVKINPACLPFEKMKARYAHHLAYRLGDDLEPDMLPEALVVFEA